MDIAFMNLITQFFQKRNLLSKDLINVIILEYTTDVFGSNT